MKDGTAEKILLEDRRDRTNVVHQATQKRNDKTRRGIQLVGALDKQEEINMLMLVQFTKVTLVTTIL
jgi:hypothetical protein